MNMRTVFGAALVVLASASAARANLLVNGGLEPAAGTTVNQYNLIVLAPGSSALPGWTITSGTVDLVPGAATGNQYWQNTEGWVQPTSMLDPTVRDRPVGHIFNTITNGIRSMPPYGDQIAPADRWAIVAYIRALQRSQNARLEDVPPHVRADLR